AQRMILRRVEAKHHLQSTVFGAKARFIAHLTADIRHLGELRQPDDRGLATRCHVVADKRRHAPVIDRLGSPRDYLGDRGRPATGQSLATEGLARRPVAEAKVIRLARCPLFRVG
ncbi:hypothetical protein ACS03_26915, partial [Klebsiella variicola]